MNTFKYQCNRLLGWIMNNKIIVLLGLLSFCLMVSTWALSAQRNKLRNEVGELQETIASLVASTTQAPTTSEATNTTQTSQQTEKPDKEEENPNEKEPKGKDPEEEEPGNGAANATDKNADTNGRKHKYFFKK